MVLLAPATTSARAATSSPSGALPYSTNCGRWYRRWPSRLAGASPLMSSPLRPTPRPCRPLLAPLPGAHAEAVDALSVLEWASSGCPVCGAAHREVVKAFPPPILLRGAIAKALEDRARCVLVVPVAVVAPHWHKLLAASVLSSRDFPEGFLRVRQPLLLLDPAGSYRPTELAIFDCDFGRLSPRAGLPPGCGCHGALLRRPRPACGSHSNFADRSLFREQLLALPSPPFPPCPTDA